MAKSAGYDRPKLTTRSDNIKARSAEKRRKRAEANPGANSGYKGSSMAKEPGGPNRERILKQNSARRAASKASYRKDQGVVASPKATKRALAKGKRY